MCFCELRGLLNVIAQGHTMPDSSSKAKLPFKPGQLAEERSFERGYRGAWFRCKIGEITEKQGDLGHIPKYVDYPGHKSKWTKLYKVNTKRYKELMLRPAYPPCHNEKHILEVSEVIVIVSDSWKVGDLVDWWNSYCYWCGRITELHGDQEAQVELKRPPLGEGESYKVQFKDLRPSLDWSLEHGWTLPTQEDNTGPPCARLIKPVNQVIHRMIQVDDTNNEGQGSEGVPRSTGLIARSSSSSPALSNSAVSSELKCKKTTKSPSYSRGTTLCKKPEDDIAKRSSQGCGNSNIRKRSRADTDSKQSSAEREVEVVEDNLNHTESRQTTEQEVKVVEDDLNSTDSMLSTAEQGMIRVDDTNNEGQGSEGVRRSAGLIARSSLSSRALSNSAVSSELMSNKTTKMQRYSQGTTLSKKPDDVEKSRKRSRADANSKKSSADREVEVVEDNLNHTESRQNTAEQEVKVGEDDLNRTDSRHNTAEQGIVRVDDTNNEGQGSEGVPMSAGLIAMTSLSSPALANSGISSELKSKKTTKEQRYSQGSTLSKKPKDDIGKSSSQGRGDSNIRKRSREDTDSKQSSGERKVEVVEDNLNRTESRQNAAEQEVKVVKDDSDRSDSMQSSAEQEVDVENNLDPKHDGVSGGGALKSKNSDILEAAILDLEEYINNVKRLKTLLLGGISSSVNQGPQWKFVEPSDISEIPK